MASRSFRRWMGLLIPSPSSKSSSVRTSSTWNDRSPTLLNLTPESKRFHLKTAKWTLKLQSATLPLLTFSEQARMYMGIPMTTSSHAWTAPALHCDMQVFRVSSACWSRSSCSSPSDRLCCVRLSESAMVRLWMRHTGGTQGSKRQDLSHGNQVLSPHQYLSTYKPNVDKVTGIVLFYHVKKTQKQHYDAFAFEPSMPKTATRWKQNSCERFTCNAVGQIIAFMKADYKTKKCQNSQNTQLIQSPSECSRVFLTTVFSSVTAIDLLSSVYAGDR